MGVKADAVPGRLNQIYLYIKNDGIYYGQCSELCGVNHGFMPILLRLFLLLNFEAGLLHYAINKSPRYLKDDFAFTCLFCPSFSWEVRLVCF